MEDKKPLVSIALCTYNGEKFLKQQLNTLVKQTYPNIEIIVCDDGSTDSTKIILSEYQLIYPCIKTFFNERNTGYTKNFEKAIKQCTGEYIALADQDDTWELNKISLLIKNIDDNILIYHDSSFINHKGEQIGNDTMGNRYNMYQGDSCLPFILSNCISGHAILFKKELLNFIFPFDERFYHDWWLVYVAFNVGKVKYLDKVLVQYRQHNATITDSLNIKQTSESKVIAFNIEWIKYCLIFPFNKNPLLIKQYYTAVMNAKERKKKLTTFLFLLKNFDLIFYICYSKKNFLSKINRIRKILFNAKNHFTSSNEKFIL